MKIFFDKLSISIIYILILLGGTIDEYHLSKAKQLNAEIPESHLLVTGVIVLNCAVINFQNIFLQVTPENENKQIVKPKP